MFTYPVDSWVAKFLGMQVLRPEWVNFLDKGYARVGIGGATLMAQAKYHSESNWMAVFHPDDAQITKHVNLLQPTDDVIPMVIDKIIPLGPLVRIELTGPVSFTILVLRRQYSELTLNPGDAVDVRINADSLQLVPEATADVLRADET